METLSQHLEALGPKIAEICRVSGTPGLSLGVLYRGNVYLNNYGYRNVSAKSPPTSDTNYCIASMGKAFTSAALGILVGEGKIQWDTLVKNVLPDFASRDTTVNDMLNITDLLSHRTGLQRADSLWEGAENETLLDQAETINVFNNLQLFTSFRGSHQYNNWNYALAGEIIEHIAGETYADFVARRILEPLGMARTTVNGKENDVTNVAEAYQTLDDASPVLIPRPQENGSTMMASASGIRSNVNDLLKFYQSILKSSRLQFSGEKSTDGEDVLMQLPAILSSHQSMGLPNYREKSYGLAWARSQLPGAVGDIGMNPYLVSKMPSVARGSSSLVWWHQGCLIGFTSYVAILPEIDAAVVVLTNSTALNDAADWIGQMLVETVLDSPEKNDYVRFASESAQAALAKARGFEEALEAQKDPNSKSKPLNEYVGRYAHPLINFFIDVSEEDGCLMISFQGRRTQSYPLHQYKGDTFCWYLSRNEQAKRARWYIADTELYKIHFGYSGGKVDHLIWKFDDDVPEGAVFRKSA